MPITFEEMVQTVLNTVKEREQAMAMARQLADKVKELEGELAEAKKEKKDGNAK